MAQCLFNRQVFSGSSPDVSPHRQIRVLLKRRPDLQQPLLQLLTGDLLMKDRGADITPDFYPLEIQTDTGQMPDFLNGLFSL